VHEISGGDFKVHKVFFHKDFGVFAKLTSKSSGSADKSAYMFYLPRTSLFTGKDTNQVNFKLQDLQIIQNPNLQKDVSFIGFFEQIYHVFLAKDLIKSADNDVYENKNTYHIKEKFLIKSPNGLDFKLNLQLGYCTTLNLCNEVFERPYVTHYLKQFSSDLGG